MPNNAATTRSKVGGRATAPWVCGGALGTSLRELGVLINGGCGPHSRGLPAPLLVPPGGSACTSFILAYVPMWCTPQEPKPTQSKPPSPTVVAGVGASRGVVCA